MAFVVSTLQENILNIFTNMTGSTATNEYFADNLAKAVVTFVGTGEVSTDDSGAIAGGAFSEGHGTGKLSVSYSSCAKIILDACDYMNEHMRETGFDGDNYFAEQLGAGFLKMADEGVVTTIVVGKLVTTSTPPATIYPYGGTATGSISCSATNLIQALKSLFKEMYRKAGTTDYDGNLEFAKKLSTELKSFWENGRISTSGVGNLQGSSGSGSIS